VLLGSFVMMPLAVPAVGAVPAQAGEFSVTKENSVRPRPVEMVACKPSC
jgi:hypothetical protein